MTKRAAAAALAAFAPLAIGGAPTFGQAPPGASFRAFETVLAASVPHCFSTTDIDAMASQLSTPDMRCKPILISFGYGKPPARAICMASEKFGDGPIVMQPPLLLLVIEGQCITRVVRH